MAAAERPRATPARYLGWTIPVLHRLRLCITLVKLARTCTVLMPSIRRVKAMVVPALVRTDRALGSVDPRGMPPDPMMAKLCIRLIMLPSSAPRFVLAFLTKWELRSRSVQKLGSMMS